MWCFQTAKQSPPDAKRFERSPRNTACQVPFAAARGFPASAPLRPFLLRRFALHGVCGFALRGLSGFALRGLCGFALRSLSGFALCGLCGFALRGLCGFALRGISCVLSSIRGIN